MATYQILYWQDIPSLVEAREGGDVKKEQLSQRFQEAIDRAAMRAGKGSSDAYIAEWRRDRSTLETDDELGVIAKGEIDRLESEFSDERLQQMIKNHGSNEPQ